METIVLYKVFVPEESRVIGYTKDPEVARDLAKGNGFWGSDASILKETIKVFDSIEDFMYARTERDL